VKESAIIERHRDRPRGNGGVGSGAESLVPSRRYAIRSANSVPLGFRIARARTKLESRCTGALSAETRSFALSVSGEGEREGENEREREPENVRVHTALCRERAVREQELLSAALFLRH